MMMYRPLQQSNYVTAQSRCGQRISILIFYSRGCNLGEPVVVALPVHQSQVQCDGSIANELVLRINIFTKSNWTINNGGPI